MRVVDPLYPAKADPVEIRRALDILADGVFEIRIPKAGRHRTIRGYFNDREAAAKAVANWSGNVPAVYITLNPVNPALLARASNRLETYAETTTSDADITARHWLLIDLDPKRPAGISASAAEHKAALARAEVVREWLASQAWPEPVTADSGNGAHLLYRLALAIDAENTTVIHNSLKALASRFDTPAVVVDTSVHNLSRISKLYGTWTCKGDNTPDRPHRLSRILHAPATLEPVALELLEDLARQAPEPETRKPPPRADTWQRSGDFFGNVNGEALRALSAWVPTLLPGARPYRDGYRVSSRNLQRDCEEDLGIQPDGIKDFGVHDTGDRQGGRRTPIDLVMEYGMARDAKEAALWLCDQMGVSPDTLGWRKAERQQPPPNPPPEPPPITADRSSAAPDKPRILIPLSKFIGAPRPPDWRIRRVLPAASIIQVFGEASAGKSFMTVDWACCIASGLDWFGHAVKQAVVLYLAGEGLEGLRLRFLGWQMVRGAISDEFLHVTERPLRLDAEGARAVMAEVAEMPVKPGFIVVDTMATVMEGSENDGKDVSAFLAVLQRFISDSRATVVFNHHPGHGDKTRGRGWSGIKGNVDASFQVTATDTRKGKLTVEKPPKDGLPLDPVNYELRIVELPEDWRDPDYPDEAVTTCLFTVTGAAEPDEPKAKYIPPSQRVALEALRAALMRSGADNHADAPGVVSVELEAWRKAFYELEPDKTDESRKKSFQRVRTSLLADDRIKSQNSRFWIPAQTRSYENA